jgi:hypothetical protein
MDGKASQRLAFFIFVVKLRDMFSRPIEKTRKSRFRLFLKLGLFITLPLLLVLGLTFLYFIPNNPVSDFAFKVGYFTSPDTQAYLQFYSPVRRDIGAGYLSPGVDSFLCGRAESNISEQEVRAIANFYTIQAVGREGNCIYRLSDPASERLVSALMRGLYENDSDSERRIILVEEIRSGEFLGKGKISTSALSTNHPGSTEEWRTWMETKAMPLAKERMKAWWESPSPWSQKRNVNPLEETELKVYACCG